MAKFSESLAGSAKIKNHRRSKPAKIEIRRRVLDAIGTQAVVLDAFAGTGEMHAAVWSQAAGYVGCDMEWARDDRLAYVCDNRRVLRCLDLGRFTIFDLDAFGSPWEQAAIVTARRVVRAGERIGLVLTEGSNLGLKMGSPPTALRYLAGVKGKPSGLGRWHDQLIDRAIAGIARRMRCTIEHRWQAQGKTGAAVRYIGLVMVGADRPRGV